MPRAQGKTYDRQLKNLSWPVATDLPAHAQHSARKLMPQAYNALHPMDFSMARETYETSFANQYGSFGMHVEPSPRKQSVHERLFTPTRNLTHPGLKAQLTSAEVQADDAFAAGLYGPAIQGYSLAIQHKASLFCYEKRCAALAHVGRYREALQDAEFVLANCSSAELGSARMRVRAIKDFLKKVDNFEPGYHHAVSTLICLLRPREHRQVVPSSPSLYGRPETAQSIGKGLTGAASVGSLLAFDKDGDGNIDMDEFEAGILTLGYKAKKSDKKVFKGGPTQRGVI